MNPTGDTDLLVATRSALLDALEALHAHRRSVIVTGIPVDIMVPETLAGGSGRRGARIAPHSKHAARRAAGLEAALVDNSPMLVTALAQDDDRVYSANVAGPAALLVAKLLDHNRSKQSILVWVWICVGALHVVEGRL